MSKTKQPRVLTVAGSDSSGGAGIQADIKTITVLGGYASSAITALTAQNTNGVKEIIPVEADFIKTQMRVVLEDIGADVIKLGMLFSGRTIFAVSEVLEDYPDIPVVLDPVMVAKGGQHLLAEGAVKSLKKNLIPKCELITPNIPEAEALSDTEITDIQGMIKAGHDILTMGPKAVLVKGAHLAGDDISDVLVFAGGQEIFKQKRIKTRHTHGTGCTLSSAIATYMASGVPLKKAVALARDYVLKALVSNPELGTGQGPLGHNFGRNFID